MVHFTNEMETKVEQEMRFGYIVGGWKSIFVRMLNQEGAIHEIPK